ncbi:MAG: M42 family metallopeptidase [Desulfarculales bacterium]|jgi:endoglucanase|nr:M42 family metallopeptidase [Desulfarculales bacterium]
MNLLTLLQELCLVPAPSGQEGALRELIAAKIEPFCQDYRQDRSGNLQAWLGTGQKPCLMLDAHMDEVGVMVQSLEDNGCLRLTPLGGLDARLAPGSRVLLLGGQGQRINGIIGLAPPHVAAKNEFLPAWEDLYLDIGAGGRCEAQALGAEIGACGVLDAGQGMIGKDGFFARNLDDRVGCALLIWLLEELAGQDLPYRLCFNFSSAEEVGLRGAAGAAFHIAPDLALVLEATVGDTPGLVSYRHPSLLGQGPAITVMDGRQIVPRELVLSLERAARRAGVTSQRKRPPFGGTDGGAIALSRAGVPTAVLSIPTRYIHSPVSWLRLADLEAGAALIKTWILHHCPLGGIDGD